MKLRILIADDESLARARLRRFLRAEEEIEIVAECANGRETVNAIRNSSPDVIFLDIQMPELDGFRVLESLEGWRLPAIVFVTAHEQFALRAFEIHAVDYLLKPFDRERLQMALARARERVQGSNGTGHSSSQASLFATVASRSEPLERVVVKSGDRIRLVKVADIDWISSADNYVELHVGSTACLLRGTLHALWSQLPQNQFARISRSALVNVDRIQEIQSKSHGDYVVVLRHGTRLPGSRKFRQPLENWLRQAR